MKESREGDDLLTTKAVGLRGFRGIAGPLLAVLTPLVLAFGAMGHFVFAMPYLDDYDTVVAFAQRYLALRTVGSRLLFLLESQHMEYKFVVEHAVVALDLALGHRLHFMALQVVGDCFLAAIFWLIWRLFEKEGDTLRQRLILFVPVSLLFFGINYAELVNFPSASLDYLPALFFSFVAIWLLAGGTTNGTFALACGSALLAYGSAVNGFLLGPIGLLLLLRQKAWGKAAGWCAVGVLGLTPYLYRYVALEHHGQQSLLRMPLFFLSLLGAATPSAHLAVPLGLITVGVFVWAVRTGFERTHRASLWCWVWLLLTAAMTAYGRSGIGLWASLASRYKLFADLGLIFCYQVGVRYALSAGVDATRRVLCYRVALGVALVFSLRADFYGLRYLQQRQQAVETGERNFVRAPESESPIWFPTGEEQSFWAVTEENARQRTVRAVAEGLFRVPGE